MKSMTGYARREVQEEAFYLMIEIKSYNNRYLDIYVNLPGFLSPVESEIRGRISEFINRGKVECVLRYRSQEKQRPFVYDPHALAALIESLASLRRDSGIEDPLHLSHVLRFEEQIRTEQAIDIEDVWSEIVDELDRALSELDAERTREGETTKASLKQHRDTVASVLELIEGQAARLDNLIREQVRSRFEEILGNRVDEDRMLAEVASLLVRFSIDEEISRLHGHIDAFDAVLEESGPIGKKLDFLCQELNREVNTIGSKSPLYEINEKVVEAKDAIEKMREQLRNVE